jgi:hypothetical protein
MYEGMASFTVGLGKRPKYSLDKSLSGPHIWFEHGGKQKNLYPCWKLNLSFTYTLYSSLTFY